jgi:transcriptional regulator with XRE-family HTH domain
MRPAMAAEFKQVQMQALAQRILTKAGFKLGGASLAEYLGVADATLAEWLLGKSIPPVEVVLKAVQLLEPEMRVNGSDQASGSVRQ